jgi:hypothetical protein
MSIRRHRIIRDLAVAAFLLLATLGFFWRILFTHDAWKPAGGGDLVSFLFPAYRFAATNLTSGNLPLWNPHLYGGAPFLADMQTGLFYLPNQVLFRIAPDFSYKALEWMAVLHVYLAGLFMYLCLRYLEPGRPLRLPAATGGALAFMFSDLFIVHFGNLNLIAVTAWLPLVFLLFWRALRGRSLGLAAGAGVALGLSTLEGHLQITLYIGLALVITAIFEAASARRSGKGWAWSLLALAITALVGVSLSALVLFPAIEYARLSPRAELSYRDAARYSLVPGLLGEFLVPALFGSREPALYWGVWDRVAAGYLGIMPLVLAALACVLRRGRRVALFAVLAALAFLLALGGESVFHGWAYKLLPGFGQLRAPARAILLLDFALAALAALGLDQLLGPLGIRARAAFRGLWRGLIWFSALAMLVGGSWAYLVIYQAQDRDPTLFWRISAAGSGVLFALVLLGLTLAWLGARRSGRLRRTTLGWLAVALIFVDLASVGAYTDLGTEPPTAGFDHPQSIEFLQSDSGFFRIDSRTDVWGVWQPSLALLAGLYDVSGVDNPLVVGDIARYWEGTGGRSTQLYDLLGVRYVLGSKEIVLDWDKFTLADESDPQVNIYRNEAALPRAFVVHRVIVVQDQEGAWARIHQPDFDPASAVVLEGGQPLEIQPVAGDRVEVTAYESDRVVLEVDAEADGYLFLSDPFYPGWRAEIDGTPAEILRANYAFRAIALPAGSHRVTMTFQPATWTVGLGVSVLAGLLIIVAAGVAFARRDRDR